MDSALHVRKRDGRMIPYDVSRIELAVEKAYRSETNIDEPEPLPISVALRISRVKDKVVSKLNDVTSPVSVEQIQNYVEESLASEGDFQVARKYILYRESQLRNRIDENIYLTHEDGRTITLSSTDIRERILDAVGTDDGLVSELVTEVKASIRSGSKIYELDRAIVFALRTRIERYPQFAKHTAKALLRSLLIEYTGRNQTLADVGTIYRTEFARSITEGIKLELFAPELLSFDIVQLAQYIAPTRDDEFRYLGLQTLADRYLTRSKEGKLLELPQTFWMRVAMGLALGEAPDQRTKYAKQFYDMLSSMRVVSSTPTLFNAGTTHPQLSSCYLLTVEDDLESIFNLYADDAQLTKWSGGIGNDLTPIRALGSYVKGTNGKSAGIVPFLKILNDVTAGVTQGSGRRRGATCAYLETWHLDIEDFLDLRKNVGDERRRTHDLNTANWIPDLFMKRVEENGTWTLFSPSDTPELHEMYGSAFETEYTRYEALAASGAIVNVRKVQAVDLWRKMLGTLFETGHPWITFKDPSNIRSPQDHVGVVHSSNLCTEILLNTSNEETAVCNLASINLTKHVNEGRLNREALSVTVSLAMRMLDNVIDINFYPTEKARISNMRHRPVGLGIMGFQDALWKIGVSYASPDAVEFADTSMEMVSYYALLASARLARERGKYESYEGSKWSKGLLPIDTIALVESERNQDIDVNRTVRLDWSIVRESIRTSGLRNSNTMAIAPTATISNIAGVTQSIEPMFSNLFVKSNLSGEFTIVNEYLVAELDSLGLWDTDMLEQIKYHDGSVALIERIPLEVRIKYPTAFEIEPEWLIDAAAHRQKWIDMGQSLNLYVSEPNGKKLNDMYFLAWKKGLKTTYYLRSKSATTIEKSSIDVNKFGIQPSWQKNRSASADIVINRTPNRTPVVAVRSLSVEEEFGCESCS